MNNTAPHFSANTLQFLESLNRTSRLEWFATHKADCETYIRTPMLTIIKCLATNFPNMAPAMVAAPQSMYPIYRDIRFSSDKTPYKVDVSARFTHSLLPKNKSAALYFHLGSDELWI